MYVDDVIKALRNSGYGIFFGGIFTGCILYAVLLSCSLCGLQKNDQYDKINSTKSQCISFGGCEPSTFTVSLNDSPVLWARNFKYTSNAFLTVYETMVTVCRSFVVR